MSTRQRGNQCDPHALENRYASLILRLWRLEENPPAGADWRSELEHIQSGKHWTFQTLGELAQFLEKFLSELGKGVDR